jgi:hypothetical protein
MGSSFRKIKKTNKQILLDCIEINKITENKLFENRVGLKFEFKFIKNKKKIQLIVVLKIFIN